MKSADLNTVVVATVIRVTDLERSHAWYTQILQLQLEFRDPHYKLIQYRSKCGVPIAIWETREHETLRPADVNSAYVAFRSEDLESARREFESRGAQVGSIQGAPGLRMFWFADPDGNKFAVLQFSPE